MRARLFRGLLHRWERRVPEILRRIQLQILMNLTAKAFRAPAERLWTRPWREGLSVYVEYTRKCAQIMDTDPERLYALSFALGERLRRIAGFTEDDDLCRLVFWLYRGIGIDMGGRLPGAVTVSGCFFSDYYTPDVCALISNMDSGIVGGIMGGGRLVFSGRITEGAGGCRACLVRGRGQ